MEINEKQIMDNINYLLAAAKGNELAFKDMYGIYSNKDIAICGAGPSLLDYKPMEGVTHIALNRALLYSKVHYDWFVADDWEGIEFMQDDIIKYDCMKLLGRFSDSLSSQAIPKSFGYKCGARWFYTDIKITGNGFMGRFNSDIDKCVLGGMPNIALTAMEIFLFTLPRKIYLVGCDASQGHFIEPSIDDDKLEKINNDVALCVASDQAISKWKDLKKFSEIYYPDTEIISVNPRGLKGLFKDIHQ